MKIKVENWWGGEPTTYDVTEIRIIVKASLDNDVNQYLYEDDYAVLVLKDGTEKKVHRDYLPEIKKEKIN